MSPERRSQLMTLGLKFKEIWKVHKRKLILWGAELAFAASFLSVFRIQTILALILFVYCLILFVRLTRESILEKGLLHYLPASWQNSILRKSIFDVLCVWWFLPKITGFFKLMITPFFVKLPPEQAIMYLDELDQKTRSQLLTKGIINLLPAKFRTLLVGSEKNPLQENRKKNLRSACGPESKEVADLSTAARIPTESMSEGELKIISCDEKKANRPKEFPRPTTLNINGEFPTIRTYKVDSEQEIPSRKSIPPPTIKSDSNHVIIDQWDKLGRHRGKESNIIRSSIVRNPKIQPRASLLGPLQIVQQILEMKERLGKISQLGTGRLLSMLGGTSILLIIQLLLSKRYRLVFDLFDHFFLLRARGWLRNSFLFLLYSITMLLGLGNFSVGHD